MDHDTADTIARCLLAAGDAALRVLPVTGTRAGFDLASGLDVGARIARLREARGERICGWKIGFTNRAIWAEYGASAPIWGPMYDTTVSGPEGGVPELEAARFAEPRIEPEIALRFASAPEPGMDESALLGCIDAVAHGFELVHSIFPDWRFQAPDTFAAFGLHGRFCHGPVVAVDDRTAWAEQLAAFEIALFRDGAEVDRGSAANVLGGPLSALRHFVAELEHDPLGRGIRAGDMVTTGTVTRAFPVAAGERWSTAVTGLPLQGVEATIV